MAAAVGGQKGIWRLRRRLLRRAQKRLLRQRRRPQRRRRPRLRVALQRRRQKHFRFHADETKVDGKDDLDDAIDVDDDHDDEGSIEKRLTASFADCASASARGIDVVDTRISNLSSIFRVSTATSGWRLQSQSHQTSQHRKTHSKRPEVECFFNYDVDDDDDDDGDECDKGPK